MKVFILTDRNSEQSHPIVCNAGVINAKHDCVLSKGVKRSTSLERKGMPMGATPPSVSLRRNERIYNL